MCCLEQRLVDGPNGLNLIEGLSMGLGVKCLPVKRAGGVQDLVRPPRGVDVEHTEGYRGSIIRDIQVRIGHHGAKSITLMNHEDCKGYPNFPSRDEEIRVHLEDLRGAMQILKNTEGLQEINIRMFFAELERGTSNIFIFGEVFPI